MFCFTTSKGPAELEDLEEEVKVQHKKQVTIHLETVRDLKQWPRSDRVTQRGVMETVKKRDQENFILSLNPEEKLRVSYVSQRLIPLTDNKSRLLPRQTHETVSMITWSPMCISRSGTTRPYLIKL